MAVTFLALDLDEVTIEDVSVLLFLVTVVLDRVVWLVRRSRRRASSGGRRGDASSHKGPRKRRG